MSNKPEGIGMGDLQRMLRTRSGDDRVIDKTRRIDMTKEAGACFETVIR